MARCVVCLRRGNVNASPRVCVDCEAKRAARTISPEELKRYEFACAEAQVPVPQFGSKTKEKKNVREDAKGLSPPPGRKAR